jgi:hypothetical protein
MRCCARSYRVTLDEPALAAHAGPTLSLKRTERQFVIGYLAPARSWERSAYPERRAAWASFFEIAKRGEKRAKNPDGAGGIWKIVQFRVVVTRW